MPSQIDQNTEAHSTTETAPDLPPPYVPVRAGESAFHSIRGLRCHVRRWPADAAAARGAGGEKTVFLLHGWMDVSASFQFVVDRLPAHWTLLAPDWRGFGLSERPAADCYWFPDYLADLDRLLDLLAPDGAVDIVAHSMGGNVATLYAGVRPERVRRLVNLEGVGMPPTCPEQAPDRYREWLDALRAGASLRDYDSREAVARRLMKNDPRLRGEQAMFLAQHWGLEQPDGRFALAGDPAHRIVNPVLYRVDETLAVWRRIEAEVLWVLSEHANDWHAFVREPEYRERLAAIRRLRQVTVPGAGHMLHHDRPDAVATLIREFLS
ncbi:alpha/beta hydrolase [Zeimonas sediminis]|uniref:alpha/beta fold hydrolase n=1 Tax=Zeimonas sediminis TaxID=2944268 RepID=UPI00300E5B1D